MKYPKPNPQFVFYWWAYWAGEYVAAQYMAEDGLISQRKSKLIMFVSNVFTNVLGLLWGWR